MLPIKTLLHIGEQNAEVHRALLTIPDYADYYQETLKKRLILNRESRMEHILSNKYDEDVVTSRYNTEKACCRCKDK